MKKQIHIFFFRTSVRLIFLFLIPAALHSQDNLYKQHQVDSITAQFKKDSAHIYRFRKVRLFLNYQERNTINTPPTFNFFAPQVGIYFHEKYILGVCAYFSSTRTKKPYFATENNVERVTKNNINYFTLLCQRILYRERYFTLSIPVELGYGNFRSTYREPTGELYSEVNRPLYLFNIDLKATIKPFKWMGVSGSFGYRNTNEEVLDGVYYALGIWIGFKSMSNDINYLIKKKNYNKQVKKILES